MRIRFLSATAILCAIFLAFSAAPNGRAAGNIFEHIAIPQEPTNWSGFYAGFNTGATWNHFDIGKHTSEVDLEDQFYQLEPFAVGVPFNNTATFSAPGHSNTENSPVGGGQMGFNLQFGHFVVGGEGGFSGNTSDSQSKFEGFQENTIFIGETMGLSQPLGGEFTTQTNFNSSRTVETDWNGFIGGHLGFAWGRFFVYGSGGAAFTDVKLTAMEKADTSFFQEECRAIVCGGTAPTQPLQSDGGIFVGEVVSRKTSSHKDVLTGWYGGGGALYALTNNVSVGVDYKRVDWGDKTDHFSSGGPVFPGNTNIGVSADQVTFQVNLMLWSFPH